MTLAVSLAALLIPQAGSELFREDIVSSLANRPAFLLPLVSKDPSQHHSVLDASLSRA